MTDGRGISSVARLVWSRPTRARAVLDSAALLATDPLLPEHRVTRRQRERGPFIRPDPPHLLMLERTGRSLHVHRHELDHERRVPVSPAEEGLTDAGHVEAQL